MPLSPLPPQERSDIELIFGLDMLKRHQCCIDLLKNELRVGSANVTVGFLAEKVRNSPFMRGGLGGALLYVVRGRMSWLARVLLQVFLA